jgi:hypothetical protein
MRWYHLLSRAMFATLPLGYTYKAGISRLCTGKKAGLKRGIWGLRLWLLGIYVRPSCVHACMIRLFSPFLRYALPEKAKLVCDV